MAAGFTLTKRTLKNFEDFVLKDFFKTGASQNHTFLYDAEVSSLAFNIDFYSDIKKLEPFGTGNPEPTFFLKDLKVIKTKIIDNKHVSLILKFKTGFSIKAISAFVSLIISLQWSFACSNTVVKFGKFWGYTPYI